MSALSSAELQDFADSAEKFLSNRYSFETMRTRAGSGSQSDRKLWQDMAELGWLALALPEQHGGFGGSMSALVLLFDALGRHLVLEPLLPTILGAQLIATAGSDAQAAALLPAVASGDTTLAWVSDDGSAPDASMTAEVIDGGFLLSGNRRFVLGAGSASRLVVTATLDGGTALFLVDPHDQGVALHLTRLIDLRRASDVVFDRARAERLEAGRATEVIAATLDLAALLVSAESVGAIGALNKATVAYAQTRRQFGTAIGSFQALQHRIVDMQVCEQEARAIVAGASAVRDCGLEGAAMAVSAARVRVDRAGRRVGESAIQVHGGMGMTEELAVGHYFRRLLVNGSLFGAIDCHLDRIAKGLS